MKKQEIKEIYEKRLLSKEPKIEKDDASLLYLLKYIPRDKNAKILDAGCGNGNYCFYLANHHVKNIYGIDLFADISDKNFIYTKASVDNIPYSDNFFDFIYCFSVIFYLENPENGIKEFKRVMKKDSLVIITAHTKYSLFTLWRKIQLLFNVKSVNNLKGIRFYTSNYYKNLLLKNGFEIVRIDGYKLSFLLYAYYRRKAGGFKKYFNIDMPLIMPKITRFKWWAYIKSIIGYHSIIIARKK